ncbi:MAG: leucine-rich repeat protein [Eubacteriales bacterium]
MPFVAATCPNCKGDLRINSDEEKGYCVHCGSHIDFSAAIKTIKLDQPIDMLGYMSLAPLLKSIDEDLKNGSNNTLEFKEKLYKALELDPDNKFLYDMITSQIWNAAIVNKELVSYTGNAERVVIPEGVTKIGEMAFGRCHQLKEISLPKSINYIMANAFLFESSLIINAYNGTYGAKYAIASPAKFNLIDVHKDSEKHMHTMTDLLKELETFRVTSLENLESHFNKVYSVNWALASSSVMIPITLLYLTLRGNPIYAGAAILSLFVVIIILAFVIFKTGYDEIKRKIAVELQTKLFYKKSNEILSPLGIVDYKYYRSIFTEPDVDLDLEILKLQKARDKVISMDLSDIYEKPYIYYPFIDFISGKKPAGSSKD